MLHSAQQNLKSDSRHIGISNGIVLVMLVITMVALPGIPVAAATPTPFIIPSGCVELIDNGQFANLTNWNPTQEVNLQQFSGNNVAYIGLGFNSDYSNFRSTANIHQQIDVLANYTATLRFRYRPQYDIDLPQDSDVQRVYIQKSDGTTEAILELNPRQKNGNWINFEYSLSHLSGQTIDLFFEVVNDGVSTLTWMYVDDVSIIACPATPTPTWTPTITLTPSPSPSTTPLPVGCVSNVILNSGFEDDLFWIFGDDPVPAAYSGVEKHTGLRSVRMGIDPALGAYVQNKESFSSIRQPFQISNLASSATLTWWRLDRSEEAPIPDPGPAADRQDVILLHPDFSTAAILSRTRQNSGTWQQQPPVDLTSFRGRSLLLYFNVFNDGNGLRTWQFIDDVTLTVCFPPTPTATPMPPPTDTPTPTITATNTPAMVVQNGNGEPFVEPAQPVLRPPDVVVIVTPTPTTEVLWFGRRPSEVLTWVGVMLGGLAIIGLLAGLIAQYRNPNRTS